MRSKENKPPGKQAKRPSGRWEGVENQNVRVGNKCSETVAMTGGSKHLIPFLTLQKREIAEKALTDPYLCVKQKTLFIRNKTLGTEVTSRFSHSSISTSVVSPVHQRTRLTQCSEKSPETSSGKNSMKIGRGIFQSALFHLTDSSVITGFLLHIKRTA